MNEKTDEIQKDISNAIKFSKINHLVWLIFKVEGNNVSHCEFIDKEEKLLDSHIDYYEYALSLK